MTRHDRTETRSGPTLPSGTVRRACLAALAWAAAPLLLGGCYIETQKFPSLLRPTQDPLPEGALRDFPRGPEEALIVRHGDTVSVRMAESLSTVKLRWHDKRLRAPAGSWVFCSSSGFAEVILDGSTVIALRGLGTGVIGAPESRREPDFFFIDVTGAQIEFGEPGQVQLPGGALLEAASGTFALERVDDDVLRVANRTASLGTISYRDEILELYPSETADLALLDEGTAPFERDPRARAILTDGGRLVLRGDVDVVSSADGARLRTGESSEISGFGLVLRLEPGDEVLFQGLGSIDERRALAEAAAER
ncbi:MAG: hypothetical protein AAFU73_09000 [Planctomycetota bacterium]